jgi:hypothetical protein
MNHVKVIAVKVLRRYLLNHFIGQMAASRHKPLDHGIVERITEIAAVMMESWDEKCKLHLVLLLLLLLFPPKKRGERLKGINFHFYRARTRKKHPKRDENSNNSFLAGAVHKWRRESFVARCSLPLAAIEKELFGSSTTAASGSFPSKFPIDGAYPIFGLVAGV